MSSEATYTWLVLGVFIGVFVVAGVRSLHSDAYRPTSPKGLFNFALVEVAVSILFGLMVRPTPWSSVLNIVLGGMVGVFLVDLFYLAAIRKRSLREALKPAVMLAITGTITISLLAFALFTLIMIKGFSQWH